MINIFPGISKAVYTDLKEQVKSCSLYIKLTEIKLDFET